jgi:hypothetical protein
MKAEFYVPRKTKIVMQLHGSSYISKIKDRQSVWYHTTIVISLDNKIVCMVVVYLKTRQK